MVSESSLSPRQQRAPAPRYWTERSYSKIQRANLDGSGTENLLKGATTPAVQDPFGIALDVAAGKMYWTDPGTAKIHRASLDGTRVEELATTEQLQRPATASCLLDGMEGRRNSV